MKIRPVGAELFHEDGRTDMTKLFVGLRTFVNAPTTSPQLKEISCLSKTDIYFENYTIPFDILCGRDKCSANIPVRLDQFYSQVPTQQNPRQ